MIPYADKHHSQVIAVFRDHFKDEDISGIEIGTNAGDLTKALLNELKNIVKLYTVDPWKHYKGAEFEAGHPQTYHDEQITAAKNKLYRFGSKISMNVMTSDEFFVRHPDLRVDFCHIDGHHTYDQVKKDIINAKTVVKSNGIISGHDFGLVEHIEKAVFEEFPNKEVHSGADFTWFIYV